MPEQFDDDFDGVYDSWFTLHRLEGPAYDFRARVAQDLILTPEVDLPVELRDRITQELPDGVMEESVVVAHRVVPIGPYSMEHLQLTARRMKGAIPFFEDGHVPRSRFNRRRDVLIREFRTRVRLGPRFLRVLLPELAREMFRVHLEDAVGEDLRGDAQGERKWIKVLDCVDDCGDDSYRSCMKVTNTESDHRLRQLVNAEARAAKQKARQMLIALQAPGEIVPFAPATSESVVRDVQSAQSETEEVRNARRPGEVPNAGDSSKKSEPKRRGRKSRFTLEQLRRAQEMKLAGESNNDIAKALYGTRTTTAGQRSSVPTILKYYFPREK